MLSPSQLKSCRVDRKGLAGAKHSSHLPGKQRKNFILIQCDLKLVFAVRCARFLLTFDVVALKIKVKGVKLCDTDWT